MWKQGVSTAHCENITWKKISLALASSDTRFVCLLFAVGVIFCFLSSWMSCILQMPGFKQWKLRLYLDKSTWASCLHEMFSKQRRFGDKKFNASFFFLLLMPTASANAWWRLVPVVSRSTNKGIYPSSGNEFWHLPSIEIMAPSWFTPSEKCDTIYQGVAQLTALRAVGGHLLTPVSTSCWSAQPSLTFPWKVRNAFLRPFASTLTWFSLVSANPSIKPTKSVSMSDVNLTVP